MMKVGKYTAAFILVAVGALLLLKQATGLDYFQEALDVWPLVMVLLGVEYIIAANKLKETSTRIRLDFGGIFFAVLISIVVIAVTQGSSLNFKFLDRIMSNFGNLNFSFSEESGHKFERTGTTIPLAEALEKIIFENPNGNVVIQSGDVSHIQVDSVIWVDAIKDEQEAQKIADLSVIEHTGDKVMTITAKGAEYQTFGHTKKARMNLTITLPKQHTMNIETNQTNGKVEVTNVALREHLKIKTTNGSIYLSSVQGKVEAATTNGPITAQKIEGSMQLESRNGMIVATDVQGDLQMESTNGKLQAERVSGSLHADTTNGEISITEVKRGIEADTTNGKIIIVSHDVGGHWDLETNHGKIDITLPDKGDFRVSGKSNHGKVDTEFSEFISDEDEIRGQIGSGTHEIKLDTNSGISIRKIK